MSWLRDQEGLPMFPGLEGAPRLADAWGFDEQIIDLARPERPAPYRLIYPQTS